MNKYLPLFLLVLLSFNASYAQQRYLTDNTLDDTERIAEEIVANIYKQEPEAYLESISLINFEEVEEMYFLAYKEAPNYLLDEDSYEVTLLIDETVEKRYFNSMGTQYLKIVDLEEKEFPREILEEIVAITPAWDIVKLNVIHNTSSHPGEVYSVALAQDAKTKNIFYRKSGDDFIEIRFKDVSMIQK